MPQIELQVSDVVAAQALHVRPSRLQQLWYVALLTLLGVLLGFVFARSAGGVSYLVMLAAAGTAVGVGIVVIMALLIAVRLLYLPWMARRMYRQQKLLRDPADLEWDDRGITFRSAAAHSTIAWEDYVKWKENDRLLLVYLADRLFQIIPKRVFASSADEQDFRRHLPRIGTNLRSGRP